MQFSALAVEMAVYIGVGVVIGQVFDQKFTENKSYFTAFFSLLGVAAALYKTISDLSKK